MFRAPRDTIQPDINPFSTRFVVQKSGPETLIDLVPKKHRISLQKCILSLNCLLIAYNSSREININVYRNFVQEVYTELLMNVRGLHGEPWIFPSPTLRAFVSRSHELIDANDNHGLGNFTE